MRRYSLLTSLGLCVCLALAWYLYEARAELRQLAAETQQVNATNATLGGTTQTVQIETASRAEATERRRRLALTTLSAADRARGVVGPLIARIKAEHAAHPPTTEPPFVPPPMPPTGMFFPELMGDPTYNGLVKQSKRIEAEHLYRATFEAAGLSQDQIDRVLDLAAELGMVPEEFASAARQAGVSINEVRAQINSKQDEIMGEIQQVVGDRAFAAITKEVPISVTTANADGTLSNSQIMKRNFVTINNGGSGLILPIERRLSYSSEPLSDTQMAQFTQLIDSLKPIGASPLVRHQPFLQGARAILSPAQQAGLDQLVGEFDAWQTRAKLPQTPASAGR